MKVLFNLFIVIAILTFNNHSLAGTNSEVIGAHPVSTGSPTTPICWINNNGDLCYYLATGATHCEPARNKKACQHK
ncbi:hypothetical protein [Arsenophonus apicola]|uniref:Secreted protein n=1 Tax=Arsenophonus apicola TaxID=2879119 RepID=A0ABY8P774_9GAMM|nr:hypothetical protein [Arsenophonus apicola]WGO84710.1 hypothetical protein QG404_07570 [Arsenophonus apicola]